MGIYLPNMEMPKGCATCPYCDRAWNKPKCKAKSIQGRFMEQRLNLDRTRQKWCPLVSVPPHGDLIDRDAIFNSVKFLFNSFTVANGERVVSCDYLNAAPTIVPAEEGE